MSNKAENQKRYEQSEKGKQKRQEWVDANKEHLLDYHAQWVKDNAQKANSYVTQWRKENPEKFNAQIRRYYAANKEKIAAQRKVKRALKNGILTRPDTCQNCGKAGRIDGHHPDYSKPLEVLWLCRQCHRDQHPTSA